jgi:magnesium-transporting ATPase (P-type)
MLGRNQPQRDRKNAGVEQTREQPSWHALDRAGVESILGTGERGLSLVDARHRLDRYGPNRLEEPPPPSALVVLLNQFKSPLIYILLVATAVTLLLGEYVDAGVIAAVLVLNAIIGFVQERRTEASVRALMQLAAHRARVVREGRERELESRVSADLRLVQATNLAVDESLLTGESVPVQKRSAPVYPETQLADRTGMAYMGAVVSSGRGRGYVVATAEATELGSIAEQVREEEESETPLQQRMNRFARIIGVAVAISAGLAFGMGVLLGESVKEMFLVGVALAVSVVPEGLPVVLTITLALGMHRMAKRNAIIRRLPAVETLGSTTTIGSDKTGTLTENRMTVQEIRTAGRVFDVPGDGEISEHDPLRMTLLAGVLTNEAQIYPSEDGLETHAARTIARDLGIAGEDSPVLTGAELEKIDDEELRERAPETPVYARVAPEHKLRVVRVLQKEGDTVAVTGDGVNDAPALKAADIGVAMGKSGTDVAREASDMVLTDDNFVSIYSAVEEGRITFENIRKVTFFLISSGVAEVLAILAALTLGLPLPFLPAQILWLNLVTNGLQDVALAFEPGERDVLKRPPRAKDEGIISRLLWERTVLAGLVMAAGTLALFWWELDRTGSLERAQTVALTTMVLFQMFHVGNARSEFTSVFRINPFSNPFLLLAALAALVVHVAALYLPPTQFILRVEPIELEAWIRITLVASTIIAAMELHKYLRRDLSLLPPTR